ncbi:MAG: hypothetical protein P4L56_03135 [Candidatus Sulfopaludibacter sp.]|nr:hypothetical protein [Candidatus Sulfopaludibacter sp.]
MKTAHAILTVATAVFLSGCPIQRTPKVATPPAPQQAPAPAAPAPAAATQPLSMPQTEVKLAPEQPIDPEALAKDTTAASPQEAPPPTRPTRPRPRPAPPAVTVTETPAAPATPPVAASPETDRGTVVEVLPEAEKIRLKNSADVHKREVRAWLNGSHGRRLDPNNPTVVRIRSLLTASDEAEGKGDLREASDLADRAVTFLRELQSGR